jgi:hypothetical protein
VAAAAAVWLVGAPPPPALGLIGLLVSSCRGSLDDAILATTPAHDRIRCLT